jgi:hypothetical protein
MGVHVYGKIYYCETWHHPLNVSYPNRATVNKQIEINRYMNSRAIHCKQAACTPILSTSGKGRQCHKLCARA